MTADVRPARNGRGRTASWRLADMLLQKLAAFFQKDEVHFLHREIRRDQTRAAIIRKGMLRQLRLINDLRRWHRHAVVFDEGIQPVGGRAARRSEERLKAVIDRAALDTAGKINLSDGLDAIAAHGLTDLVKKRQTDVPLADAGGGIAVVA